MSKRGLLKLAEEMRLIEARGEKPVQTLEQAREEALAKHGLTITDYETWKVAQ